MKRAIVFGPGGVNALGLVQSLGREGVAVTCVLVGKCPVVEHSCYIDTVYIVPDLESAIDCVLNKCVFKERVVIFPSGDGAAVALELNRERLQDHFAFENVRTINSIAYYMNKLIQVDLAQKHGFNVPFSVRLSKGDSASVELPYPCIVKPLVSCEGDKRDILIACDKDQLTNVLKNQLLYTTEVIVQQLIDRDYDYNMVGCSFSNGDVFIPLSIRATKFNHKVQDAKTVCFVEPLDDRISHEVEKMKKLIQDIGYVGLFAVECMHNRVDDKIYFTEINLRNDGLNSFIVKSGVNLPYLHYLDMLNLPLKKYIPFNKPRKYIWEANHLSALKRHSISIWEWLTDLIGVNGFLFYYKDDKLPFYYQFIGSLISKFSVK